MSLEYYHFYVGILPPQLAVTFDEHTAAQCVMGIPSMLPMFNDINGQLPMPRYLSLYISLTLNHSDEKIISSSDSDAIHGAFKALVEPREAYILKTWLSVNEALEDSREIRKRALIRQGYLRMLTSTSNTKRKLLPHLRPSHITIHQLLRPLRYQATQQDLTSSGGA